MPKAETALDASAVLAYLQSEPGEALVAEAMKSSCISAVNVAEIIAKLVERGLPDETACDLVATLPCEIVPFDLPAAQRAGLLHRATRGKNVSLGDRACLALALDRKAPALTADRALLTLDVGVDVRAIR